MATISRAARAEDPYLELDDMFARLRGTLHGALDDLAGAAPATSIVGREVLNRLQRVSKTYARN